MELTRFGAVASALLFLLAQDAAAKHHHNDHLHRLLRTRHLVSDKNDSRVEKRDYDTGGQCQFPDDPDLVAVTRDMKNKGWAMAPDKECTPGKWCPYACVSGKVMAQWEPDSSYTVGSSINGGLYCDESGKIKKPFKDSPYCVEATGALEAVNEAGDGLSFCQTVLPGDEDMIIPTAVGAGSSALLAVPDTSYWCGTSAHYYINAPGIGVEGCIWGHKSKALGNWTPYVAGGNTDKNGNTFAKIGWNPVFFEESALMAQIPTFGVRLTCDDDAGCNGLPCEIDPTKGGLNTVNGKSAPISTLEGNACIVTVPKGKKAKITVFNTSGKSTGISIQATGGKDKEKAPEPKPETSSTQAPEPSTSAMLPPPPSSTTSSTSTSTSISSAEESPSSSLEPSSTKLVYFSSSVGPSRPSITPGIFHENSSNGTSSDDGDSSSVPTTEDTAASDSSPEAPSTPTESQQGEGLGSRHQGSAAAGLLVAFVALIYLL